MRVEVLIPYRAGCPYREVALAWVLDRYSGRPDRQVRVLEDESTGPWVKARSINEAARDLEADIVIVADADVWCDGIDAAVQAVSGGAPWAMPHTPVRRLTEVATADVIAGADPWRAPTVEPVHRGVFGGGLVVLEADTLRRIPLDPRFEGWGGEDTSFGYALNVLAGHPWRGTAPLVHLWHPPQERPNRKQGSPANEALRHRYRLARASREAMRKLISEVHSDDISSTPLSAMHAGPS